MAYQPLYGRLTDNAGGCAHTLSLRGRVDDIGFWLNSQMGTVMNVDASGGEHCTNYHRIQKCNERIKELTEEMNLASKDAKPSFKKKIDVWNEKLKDAQEKDVEMKKHNKVHININLHEPEHKEDGAEFIFNLNGIRLTNEDLAILQKYQQKEFLGKLGVVAAFGMIPDIKRLADAEGKKAKEEAAKNFIKKRDNITKFLKGEEEKIGELPPIKLGR